MTSLLFIKVIDEKEIKKDTQEKETVKEILEKKEEEKESLPILEKINTTIPSIISIFQQEEPIGKIKIKKIQLEKPLYKIDSNKNNVDKNVTILKGSDYPNKENSLLLIAAHSGMGKKAYFQELGELEIEDEIIIEYDNKEYYYTTKKIYETPKDGYLHILRQEKKQLVLTTCCPDKENCQLIIDCIEKEP